MDERTVRRAGGAVAIAGIALGLCAGAHAAPPSTMPVQGVVRDHAGNVVESGSFAMRFALYAQAEGGSVLWSEMHPSGSVNCAESDDPGCVEVTKGIFMATLGSQGTPLPTSLFRDHDALWLGIAVEGEPELPRRPLGSSGWAMASRHAVRADEASVAEGLDCTNCVEEEAVAFEPGLWTLTDDDHVVRSQGSVGIGLDDPAAELHVNGSIRSQGEVLVSEAIGIGTNSPSAPLDVQGNVRVGGELDLDGGALRNAQLRSNYYYVALDVDARIWGDSTGATGTFDSPPSDGQVVCSDDSATTICWGTPVDGHNRASHANNGGDFWDISFRIKANVELGDVLPSSDARRSIHTCWAFQTGDSEGAGGGPQNGIDAQGFDSNGGHEHVMGGNEGYSSSAPSLGIPVAHVQTRNTQSGSHEVFAVMCQKQP